MSYRDDLKAVRQAILPERQANERDDAMNEAMTTGRNDEGGMTADTNRRISLCFDAKKGWRCERWNGRYWENVGDYHETPLMALDAAATEFVREPQEVKVETINSGVELDLTEIRDAGLHKLTDLDGTVRVVQRWPDWVVSAANDWLSSNAPDQGLADQRAIRRQIDGD